jgi:hypothetical protein
MEEKSTGVAYAAPNSPFHDYGHLQDLKFTRAILRKVSVQVLKSPFCSEHETSNRFASSLSHKECDYLLDSPCQLRRELLRRLNAATFSGGSAETQGRGMFTRDYRVFRKSPVSVMAFLCLANYGSGKSAPMVTTVIRFLGLRDSTNTAGSRYWMSRARSPSMPLSDPLEHILALGIC